MDTVTQHVSRRDSILVIFELRALWVVGFLYLLSFFFYLASVLQPASRSGRRAARLFFGGALIHAVGVVLRTIEVGRLPLQAGFEAVLGFAWLTALIYLFVQRKFRTVFVAGLPVAGICSALCLYAIARCYPGHMPPLSAMHDGWFHCRDALIPVSYALFTVAFSVECGYFVLTALMPAPTLVEYSGDIATVAQFHRMTHQLVLFGFPFLTVGLAAGAIWAEQAYARHWVWHPHETWGLITWILYAAYLHAMTMSNWRRRTAPILNMMGFVSALMAILSAGRMPEVFMTLDALEKLKHW